MRGVVLPWPVPTMPVWVKALVSVLSQCARTVIDWTGSDMVESYHTRKRRREVEVAAWWAERVKAQEEWRQSLRIPEEDPCD